jgi:cytidylate kinase
MSKTHRIILLGANGSGKSTLGRELARALDFAHIDVEEYYFYQSDIPYTAMRPVEERNAMLLADMKKHGSFVMSGDISGWGEEFITGFDLAIFLTAPTDIRLKRIEKREHERWGDRVRNGGDMYDQQQKFLKFAASRDIPQLEQKALLYSCPILHIDGKKTIDENASEIIEYIKEL